MGQVNDEEYFFFSLACSVRACVFNFCYVVLWLVALVLLPMERDLLFFLEYCKMLVCKRALLCCCRFFFEIFFSALVKTLGKISSRFLTVKKPQMLAAKINGNWLII